MFEREYLKRLLALCTEDQRTLFGRMYPSGPNDEQLARATDQVETTLRGNNKKLGPITAERDRLLKVVEAAQDVVSEFGQHDVVDEFGCALDSLVHELGRVIATKESKS